MVTASQERLQQFQRTQHNLSRVQSKSQCFEQAAARRRQEEAARLQAAVTQVQEAASLEQEAALVCALAKETRARLKNVKAQVKKAEALAREVKARAQEAQEVAACFEGKHVYFSTRDEARALADLKKEYHISVRGRISIKIERGKERADLRAFAKELNILE